MDHDKMQHRRFFTDAAYRAVTEATADSFVKAMQDYSALPVNEEDYAGDKAKDYFPAVDAADIAAGAILSELSHRLDFHYEVDHHGNHDMNDMVASIIRKSMAPVTVQPPEATFESIDIRALLDDPAKS
jgi:hypothetical protein